jgi:AraC family transcriptional regulator
MRRMTGNEYIRESLEIFERSLRDGGKQKPIGTVGELARLTGYSVYHFTRLFAAVTGMNPKEYLSLRILTEAAKKIASTTQSLSSIAELSGFRDYETFSRAFKKYFGVAPIRVREAKAVPPGCVERADPSSSTSGFPVTGTGPRGLPEPEIVELGGHFVTGLSFFIGFDSPSFHKEWGVFMNAQKSVLGRIEPEVYCQFSSWTDDESVQGLSVLCGLVTNTGIAQHPLFTTRAVPSASYIRFLHAGGASGYRETYEYIYGNWLAGHDVVPLNLWEFQRYTDGGKTTEIYIPVALL